MTDKIKMKTPLVDIDGDEMARVVWSMVKEKLLQPYVDLKTVYCDLGLKNRDATDDQITLKAIENMKIHHIGVKCATITPNASRVKEYNLKKKWPSANGELRSTLDGTIFRRPIVLKNIRPAIRFWKEPIIVGRHAYGDLHKNVEYRVDQPGIAELAYFPQHGEGVRLPIHEFQGHGVIKIVHNIDVSISNFAKMCFEYALEEGTDLWFTAKDTVSSVYDARFKETFEEIYEVEYKDKFEKAGVKYFYTLTDDAIARVVRSKGGFLWACKNYDGDVMSDFVASAYGSLGVMMSVLVSPHGRFLFEAAHGTVQKHYYKYLKGVKTSTNSLATIFAWTGALKKKGELDKIPKLVKFATRLEKAAKETVEIDGIMTADLALMSDPPARKIATTEDLVEAISNRLERRGL